MTMPPTTATASANPTEQPRSRRRRTVPTATRARPAISAPGLAVGAAFTADGVAVAVLAAADARSRSGASGGYPLFWLGLALIFLPSAAVLLLSRCGRRARLTVALGFGLALYLAKVVYEPTVFTFHDEFAHYRNAANLLTSGQLFGYNPLIRATGYYPGLAVATNAIAHLTGFSIYTCGLIIIACARLTLVGALFLLVDELLESPRAAGVAVVVYAAGPNFLYWDAQYGYESLALPLAILTVYFLARRAGRPPSTPALLSSLATALAVVATHHITAWALAILLLTWAAAAWLRRRPRNKSATPTPDPNPTPPSAEFAPTLPATVTAATAATWVLAVAPITVGYLGPVLSRAAVEGFQLITKLHTSRTLFANTGQAATAPAWERITAIVGTLAILAVIPVALYRSRRTGLPALAKLLAWSSLAWVALLPLRFTAGGQETANRSSEFLYIGIGICFALLLEPFLDSSQQRLRWLRWSQRWRLWWRQTSALALVTLLFVGGVSVSWNYSQRLAVDYQLTKGTAVVTPDDQALARWMLATLGPGHRVATDDQTGLELGSVGRQDVLSWAENRSRPWQIFYPPAVTSDVLAEIHRSAVQYVVVQQGVLDLPTGAPRFDDSEPTQYYNAPLPAASLAKFDASPVFREIYAAGSLRLYQVVGSPGGPSQ